MIKLKITIKTNSKTIKIKKEYADFSKWCFDGLDMQGEVFHALNNIHKIDIDEIKSITVKMK